MAHHPTPTAARLDPGSIYLTILNEQLERRQRDHGRAFLSPSEDAWLRANGLRQDRRYADIPLREREGIAAHRGETTAARARIPSRHKRTIHT